MATNFILALMMIIVLYGTIFEKMQKMLICITISVLFLYVNMIDQENFATSNEAVQNVSAVYNTQNMTVDNNCSKEFKSWKECRDVWRKRCIK